jgi:hypothetical protein
MRNLNVRLAAVIRLAVATLAVVAIATPASAQFGGLKKRVKAKAGQEAVSKAPAEVPANGAEPADQGGMIVLTDDVVKQLLAGLEAGQAERQTAAKADTPFGRYNTAKAAFAVARPKCEAAQETFFQRLGTNQKMLDRYNAFNDKMIAAQEKGNTKLVAAYQDSSLAMQDPSCIVKEPEGVPTGYYQEQRELDLRAEKKEIEASGLSRSELAIVKERADAILRGAEAPGGSAPEEKAAVSAKAAQLKPLLGIVDQPKTQAAKPAPAPTPAATATVDPKMPAGTSDVGACIQKNILANQTRIEALAQRAEAAQDAGDTPKLMAIADTVNRIQMAGCGKR